MHQKHRRRGALTLGRPIRYQFAINSPIPLATWSFRRRLAILLVLEILVEFCYTCNPVTVSGNCVSFLFVANNSITNYHIFIYLDGSQYKHFGRF